MILAHYVVVRVGLFELIEFLEQLTYYITPLIQLAYSSVICYTKKQDLGQYVFVEEITCSCLPSYNEDQAKLGRNKDPDEGG